MGESDPWEAIRHVTIDQVVTRVKLEGSAFQLYGHTKPEGWPFVVVVAIGKPGNERAVELAQKFHEGLTTAGASLRAAKNPEYAGKLIVHILRHGLPLCGFSKALPKDWPVGNVWVSYPGIGAVTCEACRAEVKG